MGISHAAGEIRRLDLGALRASYKRVGASIAPLFSAF